MLGDPTDEGISPMVELKPGARLQSTVCSTEVIVVQGAGDADVTCGGSPMVACAAGDDGFSVTGGI